LNDAVWEFVLIIDVLINIQSGSTSIADNIDYDRLDDFEGVGTKYYVEDYEKWQKSVL